MLTDVDWAEHWRNVQAVRAEQGGNRRHDFWDRRAPGFAMGPQLEQSAGFLAFLEPWLCLTSTLIDVGAGVGNIAASLSERLRWVKAVEPSQGMRSHIPSKPNLTVIPATWQDAEVGMADLVICVHVLYSIVEPVHFIEKLQMAATERVFIVMRDSPHTHPAEHLATSGKIPAPRLRECFMLLRQIGIAPDVVMFTQPTRYYFANLEAAVEECRLSIGSNFDERLARSWLAEHLQAESEDVMVYDGGYMTSGVLHWRPQRSQHLR